MSSVAFKESSHYTHANLRGCHTHILPDVMRLLGNFPPQQRILDVGCGNGSMAREFVKLGHSVIGVDLATEGIEIARDSCPEGRFEVLAADEEILHNLREKPFDMVYSIEVIEHLYDPAGFLKGCFAALKPGGIFLCSTPYHGYLKNLALSLTNSWDKHTNPLNEGGHIRFYSHNTLRKAIEQAGFTGVTFTGSGRFPLLWKGMIAMAKKPGAATA